MSTFSRQNISRRALTAIAGAIFISCCQLALGETPLTTRKKQQKPVTPFEYGAAGGRVTNDTLSLKKMFASGAKIFDLLDKEYVVEIAEGMALATFYKQSGIQIKGSGRLVDTLVYTTESITAMFVFSACRDCVVELNYQGMPITDKSNATTGIGYRGATFVQIRNGCTNIKVNARLNYLRYGVLSGNYALFSEGYNRTIKTNLTTFECGYPIAHYLANDVQANIYSESSHRTAYIAGCIGGFVNANFKNQYIAPIQVLITDAKTGVGRSRGTADMNFIAHDLGSKLFVANSHCAAVSLSRADPGTVFSDLNFDVYVKASDTVASTLGGFRMDSTAKSINHGAGDLPIKYYKNWDENILLNNIKVSGVVDRSQQTIAEHGSGEIYVYTTEIGTSHATVRSFTVENFTYMPGSGAKPRGFGFFMPGLIGTAKFINSHFGNETPFRYATNATSI